MLAREQVERVLREHFGEGQAFRSRDVREKLGFAGSDRDGITRMHNYLAAMEKEGIIRRLASDQKRNIPYALNSGSQIREMDAAPRITKEEAQNAKQPDSLATRGKSVLKGELAPISLLESVGQNDSSQGLLSRIEEKLRAMDQRLDSIEKKLDKALRALF